MKRRKFLTYGSAALTASLFDLGLVLPAWARSGSANELLRRTPLARYDLSIGYEPFMLDGRKGRSTSINGTVPAPLIRLKEGDDVELNVTNLLDKDSSIHWHGLLVPFPMDGVPGINFKGIPPGDTYHYKFRVKQAGTYWYHSHSMFQEQTGAYGPLIIDPKDVEPFHYDREYVVVLSDWSFEDPEVIFRNINLKGHYYNFQRRTLWDFVDDVSEDGLLPTLRERLAWGRMRMSPVDLADVTGATYTYLINGHSSKMNWSALFEPGETVRLRFINASAMTNFDVRIPGLNMKVVQADGKNVKPVDIHEFRIGIAETYDVLVRPVDRAYTVFAEALDRSGYVRATLAPEEGMQAEIPPLRPRPVRTLDDIGMGKMDDSLWGSSMNHDMPKGSGHSDHGAMDDPDISGPQGPEPFMPDKGKSSVAMVIMNPKNRLSEPGIGLGADGWKVLTYNDLISVEPQIYAEHPDREMTINLTANMERYMFSLDGKLYSEHEGPYLFKHNERLRLYMVNHTMMDHPMHLHGMWMQLENGAESLPFKHTILVKPGEVVSTLITPIEKGDWAFHCHLLYHMDGGMFQVVRVA